MLRTKFRPAVFELFRKRKFIWQQDNAPPHFSNTIQRFLEHQCSESNDQMSFRKKYQWPSRSPDTSGIANVWPMLQGLVVRSDERDKVIYDEVC